MFTHTMTRKEIYEEAKHDYYELKSRFDIETEIFFRQYGSSINKYQQRILGSLSKQRVFRSSRHNSWTMQMYVHGYSKNTIKAGWRRISLLISSQQERQRLTGRS